MDLDEWEFLSVPSSEEGFLDFHGDGEKNTKGKPVPDPEGVFNMNYFICPSPDQEKFLEVEPPLNSELPNSISKDEKGEGGEEETKEVTSETLGISKRTKASDTEADGPETDSQVCFKKLKENESVDMNFDPPDFDNRGIDPLSDSNLFYFDHKDLAMEESLSPRKIHETEVTNFIPLNITLQAASETLDHFKLHLNNYLLLVIVLHY